MRGLWYDGKELLGNKIKYGMTFGFMMTLSKDPSFPLSLLI
jgi:hypothetical protein